VPLLPRGEALSDAPNNPPPPPPRAFTQGVGLVFQWLGVTLFLVMMFICCSSSLLSKDTATRTDLPHIGWHLPGDAPDRPAYSAQLGITLAVTVGVFFGMALAGLGLGLQAQSPRAATSAVILATIGVIFWTVQTLFFATTVRSITLTLPCGVLALVFVACLILAIGAWRDMRRDPPPPTLGTLPADYKVPYSHMHQDPPEVRLAAELEQRRQKLAVQQKELEMLEAKLKRRLKQDGD
jgi:hypothetical protein